MKTQRIFGLLVGVVLTCTAASTMAVPSAPVRLTPGTVGHTMQRAGAFVTLKGVPINQAGAYDYEFQRITSAGTVTGTCDQADRSGCFAVPEGKVLIVTDIEWSDAPGGAGLNYRFDLLLKPAGGLIPPELVFRNAARSDESVFLAVREHLTGGIAVSYGTSFYGQSGGSQLDLVILRGYLLPR